VGRYPQLLAGSLRRFSLLVLAVAAILWVLYAQIVKRAAR
jgi:hypothetical protein